VPAQPGRAVLTGTVAGARLTWRPDAHPAAFTPAELVAAVERVRETGYVVLDEATGGLGFALGGAVAADAGGPEPGAGHPVVGVLPPLYPERLGDRSFCEAHGTRFPYAAGEMAGGIATTRLVAAVARAGLLGFFGAAGLDLPAVERAVAELRGELGGRPNWGVNLIHTPNEPALEERVADLLLDQAVPVVSLSAFTAPTPAAVRCAASGLRRDRGGRVVRPVRVFAKVSRPEVAERFLSPAPADVLRELVRRGALTGAEAELACHVPIAQDVTVEADSGGHTDNRPLVSVLPAVLGLRDDLARRFGYARPPRVGAAGGLGTPGAVAAAFAAGAAYVVTGSVNQAAVESGLSGDAKRMLAAAGVADVAMAPAADMFEQGVRLQVLGRGTMFAARAARLYRTYVDHPSLEAVPAPLLAGIERDVLGEPVDRVWARTRLFWQHRDPAEVDRAERDPKHRMALVFRWYLGMSSRWAIAGETARRADYQVWCGPAMGAFNRWVAGGFLAEPADRTAVQIALNLLEGAAVVTRAQQLRSAGLPVPGRAFAFRPRRLGC